MLARACIVVVLLIGAGAYASGAGRVEVPVERVELTALPLTLEAWRGVETEPLADDIVAKLGVDDYVSRRYVRSDAAPVALYVGYYDSQRQGDTIHSPQNCLPGAGWQPVESGRHVLTVPGSGQSVEVNRYVIAKGLNQQVVFYWYQGRGRIVANEYANKFLLMLDAARLGRTNGALVRIIAPVISTSAAATGELTQFAEVLLPHLSPHLP
jgi:EpsI family protein